MSVPNRRDPSLKESSTNATFNGISLAGPGRSGAVFALASAAPVAAEFSTDERWSVHVSGKDIVASGPSLPSYADTLAAGLAAVQQALDVFSVTGAEKRGPVQGPVALPRVGCV